MARLNETRAIALGLNSVKLNDELGVFRSIDFLTELGTTYINRNLEPAAKRTIILIKDIGKAAAGERMESGVFLALQSLEKMAKAASGKKLEEAGISIVCSLYSIGKASAEENMEEIVKVALASLCAIGNSAALRKLKREALIVPLSLGTIGASISRPSLNPKFENSGQVSSYFGILIPSQTNLEAASQSSDFFGLAETLLTKEKQKSFSEYFSEELLFAAGKNPINQDFLQIEAAIIQAAHSLDTFIIETEARYLLSYVILGKLSLDSSEAIERSNAAESLDCA